MHYNEADGGASDSFTQILTLTYHDHRRTVLTISGDHYFKESRDPIWNLGIFSRRRSPKRLSPSCRLRSKATSKSLVLPPIRVFLSFQAHYNQMIGKWLICTWMLSSGRLLASIGPPVFNNNSQPTIPDTIK
ncbi:hypothetical protein QYF36_014715 [Acer negundo]|nr:hypothetical protein QYF36_014715 [Acer negundo]